MTRKFWGLAGLAMLLAVRGWSDEGTVERERHWGIRGLVGYGAGLTGNNYGVQANQETPYVSHMGQDLAWSGEALYSFSPSLEVGLGLFSPLGADTQGTSDWTRLTGDRHYHDETSYQFSSMPIIASLYFRQPFLRDWDLVAGLGAGWATGGDGVSTSHWSYSGGSSAQGTNVSRDTFAGDIAYRGLLGTEYAFNPSFSVFGGISALGANFAYQTSVKSTSSNEGGVNQTSTTTTNYVDNVPAKCDDPTTVTTNHVDASGNGTITRVTDDGCRKTIVTETYASHTMTATDTQLVQSVQKGVSQSITQLSLHVGVTFRF
jgi:hypothetical protein